MSVVMCDYHGHRTDLPDAVEAGRWFDEQAESILPHGGSGQVIWFGPADGPPQLRVDIDVDVDRAALRWLPDGAHAVELSPDRAITIVESPTGVWSPSPPISPESTSPPPDAPSSSTSRRTDDHSACAGTTTSQLPSPPGRFWSGE